MYLNWESYVLKLGVRIPWTVSPEYLDWESGVLGLGVRTLRTISDRYYRRIVCLC